MVIERLEFEKLVGQDDDVAKVWYGQSGTVKRSLTILVDHVEIVLHGYSSLDWKTLFSVSKWVKACCVKGFFPKELFENLRLLKDKEGCYTLYAYLDWEVCKNGFSVL